MMGFVVRLILAAFLFIFATPAFGQECACAGVPGGTDYAGEIAEVPGSIDSDESAFVFPCSYGCGICLCCRDAPAERRHLPPTALSAHHSVQAAPPPEKVITVAFLFTGPEKRIQFRKPPAVTREKAPERPALAVWRL
jgi:hypothetical protein